MALWRRLAGALVQASVEESPGGAFFRVLCASRGGMILYLPPRGDGPRVRYTEGIVAKINVEEVRYVAALARLDLAPAEEGRLTGQLNAILEFMDQLAEVDTAGIEPTSHVLPLTNVMREDVVLPGLSNAEALANAPAAEQGHFAVPKIIE
jgi:aspartyl-tRNA(Asn)/glutamyl-tRNA(Gln) amidotransferase subunit C